MTLKRSIAFNGQPVYQGFMLNGSEYDIWIQTDQNRKIYAKFGSMRSDYSYLMDIKAYGKTEKQAVNKLIRIAKSEYKRIQKLTK